MATHLQIRDGSLLPIENLYVSLEGSSIIFRLSDNMRIPEEYGTYSSASEAYNNYINSLMVTTIPTAIQLIDSANGLLSTITVENGVLTVSQ